jgi:hypothetical protein
MTRGWQRNKGILLGLCQGWLEALRGPKDSCLPLRDPTTASPLAAYGARLCRPQGRTSPPARTSSSALFPVPPRRRRLRERRELGPPRVPRRRSPACKSYRRELRPPAESLQPLRSRPPSAPPPAATMLTKLYRALPRLEREPSEEAELSQEMVEAVRRRCHLIGVRWFAKQAGVDAANLAKVLSGRRRLSETMQRSWRLLLWIWADRYHV